MKKHTFTVIKIGDKLLFKCQSTEKVISTIQHVFFLPQKGHKDYEMKVYITLKRNGEVFDEGRFEYVDKDNKAFTLAKIIPSFFKNVHQLEQTSALELLPDMFLEGDELVFDHNSSFEPDDIVT